MNDSMIVPIFVVIDDALRAFGHRTDPRARTRDAAGGARRDLRHRGGVVQRG